MPCYAGDGSTAGTQRDSAQGKQRHQPQKGSCVSTDGDTKHSAHAIKNWHFQRGRAEILSSSFVSKGWKQQPELYWCYPHFTTSLPIPR